MVRIMELETIEKSRKYTFQIRLGEADTERFEAYIRHTGKKKYIVVCRALMEYLDRQYQDARV